MNRQKKIIKDSTLQIRISTIEKEKIQKAAEAEGMDLSTFVLSSVREKVRAKEAKAAGTPLEIDNQLLLQILEKLDQLDARMKSTGQQVEALHELTQSEKEDLKKAQLVERIYWMLQQERFRKRSRKEITAALIIEDPTLEKWLKTTTKELYNVLDLALEKLKQEGSLQLGYKGILHWSE